MNKQAYLAGFNDTCVRNGINPNMMLKMAGSGTNLFPPVGINMPGKDRDAIIRGMAEIADQENKINANLLSTIGQKNAPAMGMGRQLANPHAGTIFGKGIRTGLGERLLRGAKNNKYLLGALGTLGLAGGGAGLYSMLGGEEPPMPEAANYGLPGAGMGAGLGALAGYGLGGDATSALLGGVGGGALGYGLGNMV